LKLKLFETTDKRQTRTAAYSDAKYLRMCHTSRLLRAPLTIGVMSSVT